MPALLGRWQVLQNHLCSRKKAAGRANEKRPREDSGPAWPLLRWLMSPAVINRQCRPLNLIQLYPAGSERKNLVFSASGAGNEGRGDLRHGRLACVTHRHSQCPGLHFAASNCIDPWRCDANDGLSGQPSIAL